MHMCISEYSHVFAYSNIINAFIDEIKQLWPERIKVNMLLGIIALLYRLSGYYHEVSKYGEVSQEKQLLFILDYLKRLPILPLEFDDFIDGELHSTQEMSYSYLSGYLFTQRLTAPSRYLLEHSRIKYRRKG